MMLLIGSMLPPVALLGLVVVTTRGYDMLWGYFFAFLMFLIYTLPYVITCSIFHAIASKETKLNINSKIQSKILPTSQDANTPFE